MGHREAVNSTTAGRSVVGLWRSLTIWLGPLSVLVVLGACVAYAFLPTPAGDPPAAPVVAADRSASHPDFFTGFGGYTPQAHGLANARGEPDWPWIVALIVLQLGVVAGYLRIYAFWLRSHYAEKREDRNRKLMDLAQVFLWCAVCGLIGGVVVFFWPAHRLAAVCLLILNVWTWRFAGNLGRFRSAFTANRYQRLATRDALTDLPNRLAIHERIDKLAEEDIDYARAAPAVMFLDFDRFKYVNDSYGHDVGDALLQQIGGRLLAAAASWRERHGLDDEAAIEVGRLGGDEFVVVAPRCSGPEQAVELGEELLAAFDPAFELGGGVVVRSTPSVGVAIAPAPEFVGDLMRRADIAMYQAKADGKACVRLFDRDIAQRIERRGRVEGELAHAIDRQELALHYQPIVCLETGDAVAFEALVRWDHPDLGSVSPAEFVPLAEESRMIERMGLWAFDTAIRQQARWLRERPGLRTRLHVNVSRHQFRRGDLWLELFAIAQRHAVDPGRIVIELTEDAFQGDGGQLRTQLVNLRRKGFRVAMDDFGTGYSSLTELHLLPVDELKVDRAFLHHLTSRREYASIVQTVVSLADALGIDVIAEGIETPETVAQLQAMGCRYAQGYFFGKAAPADEASAWLQADRDPREAWPKAG